MGVYDTITIKSIKHKNFNQEHNGLEFQTKDLEPNFNTFTIDKNHLHFKNNILEYSGDLDLISYHSSKFIEYRISFYLGQITDVEQI
ncbi:hypothetical protein KNT81_gp269 [Proteus phage phiP4-3]|uniref:Uncharacterized protein n=1 Tax=Proteus phage phiP4-3 TaxID=2065203 RepID=A0A2I6PFJ5_9CAUD|nr:hypothetical protein KNT81_gp269 [Proteus phage phiP4-3]AUM58502.1 hypothetical protein phiP43_144 [Proteus phage phiP4-3]